MEKVEQINMILNKLVWGKTMIVFLLFVGILLFIKTDYLPIKYARLIIKKTIGSLGKRQGGNGITPWQAVSTALAGTLGVGSIIGVTTAITMGGAGALFWMCVSAFFGMMCKYGEIVLAIHYRVKKGEHTYIGGPMTTLENGCKLPFLAVVFSVLCIFASFGIGNLTPVQTIIESVNAYIPIPPILISGFVAIIILFLMKGKDLRIMRFNEIVIPVISVIYIGACVYLIWMNSANVGNVIKMIFVEAFNFESGIGGVSGYTIHQAIHYGITRGVFSNEAGMGSSPLSHASVEQADCVEQGFWGIFEVFFDTMVVCVLSGLVILCSGIPFAQANGVALTIACFEQGFGKFGGALFAIAMVAFALPTIIGWYYYAKQCINYLFTIKYVLYGYQLIFIGAIMSTSLFKSNVVWEIADTLNGAMAIPNLISLVILYRVVVKLSKVYIEKHGSD